MKETIMHDGLPHRINKRTNALEPIKEREPNTTIVKRVGKAALLLGAAGSLSFGVHAGVEAARVNIHNAFTPAPLEVETDGIYIDDFIDSFKGIAGE